MLLELSVAGGVTTPDELRVSVYDDTGTLWSDARVPGTGALVPESATRLGTVLIQPGATQGGLRVHVRGFAASTRVADGTLAIPARGARYALQLDGAVPADGDGDDVPDAIDDCPPSPTPARAAARATSTGGGGGGGGNGDGGGGVTWRRGGDAGERRRWRRRRGADDGGGTDAFNCDAAGACNRAIGAACTDGMQCASSFCVDGVCCANACIGPCRSCNQPNDDGTCQAYAQGTDPARRVHGRRHLQRRRRVRPRRPAAARRTASSAAGAASARPASARTASAATTRATRLAAPARPAPAPTSSARRRPARVLRGR